MILPFCECFMLTHFCRMYFPILINWVNLFIILGLLGGIFHFYSNFKRNFCQQTVENVIWCHILGRLIWVSTVCLCPTKMMLGLYGLKDVYAMFKIRDWRMNYLHQQKVKWFARVLFSSQKFLNYSNALKSLFKGISGLKRAKFK